jgi:hypothetical protein
MSWYHYNDYVPVAQRRAKALKKMEKLRKAGEAIEPIEPFKRENRIAHRTSARAHFRRDHDRRHR